MVLPGLADPLKAIAVCARGLEQPLECVVVQPEDLATQIIAGLTNFYLHDPCLVGGRETDKSIAAGIDPCAE
jgi:hypothetical protein